MLLQLNVNIMLFLICWKKYLNIRQSYLFSWYTSKISRDNFYFLMSNADPYVIRKICEYVYYLKCVYKAHRA